MNRESSMETDTLPYVKDSQWEFAIPIGNSNWGSVTA